VSSKKTKPLADAELEAYEATRDLGAELLQSIQEMKAGKGQVVFSPAIEARKQTGLSQSQFAALLGVSVRTLQGWEQGRKQPSGANAAGHCPHQPSGDPGRCAEIDQQGYDH
jgi:putative transcriptional regulator